MHHSLETGDSVYQNLERQSCTKGVKQRTHAIRERAGNIEVALSSNSPPPPRSADGQIPAYEGAVVSDRYAYKKPVCAGAARRPGSRAGGRW